MGGAEGEEGRGGREAGQPQAGGHLPLQEQGGSLQDRRHLPSPQGSRGATQSQALFLYTTR